MTVNLTKIDSFWLTCEKTSDRWPKMERILDAIKLPAKKIVGPITSPYTLGVARGYLMALEQARSGPILFIEDDSAIMRWEDEIEVPSCDALYLGTSHYGRRFGQTQIGGVIAKDCGEYFQTYNMLSMHAFIIFSDRYKAAFKDHLINFNGEGGVDDKWSEMQSDFKVLAVKSPWFYQNDSHSEEATKHPLQPIF